MNIRTVQRNQILCSSSPLRFPQKLWKLANECLSGAVSWSPHGRSILLRYSIFKEEFMSTKSDFFKTDNISSFVRQLNLYGFRKIYDHTHKQAYRENPDLHEFSNIYFQRDRPELLDKVTRKSGILKDKNDFFNDALFFSQEDSELFFDVKDELTPVPKEENSIANLLIDENKENITPLNLPKLFALDDDSSIHTGLLEPLPPQNVQAEPVKKKRGRKPGSKSVKHAKKVVVPKSVKYFVPTLKAKNLNLIYFEDDDDSIFLRNTSRDVMLSSTLPFQETPEFLELKETYQRLYQRRERFRYSSLPVTIPYYNPLSIGNIKKESNTRI